MVTPRLCLLLPDPVHCDDAEMLPEQMRILDAALARDGLSADYAPWTGATDLMDYDLVLPLLAWGYHDAPTLWRERLADWATAGVRLANPSSVLRWNADKAYLADFATRGGPVVPSVLTIAATPDDLTTARRRFGAVELIVKPTMSAGARGVIRLSPDAALPIDAIGQSLLIQPLMPAILREGEYSLFWFGGDFSHAILKVPGSDDFRVQTRYGGRNKAVHAPAAARSAAEQILALIDDPLAYARVDLVADGEGDYCLMELELIEPQLFLELAPDGGALFARAIRAAASR